MWSCSCLVSVLAVALWLFMQFGKPPDALSFRALARGVFGEQLCFFSLGEADFGWGAGAELPLRGLWRGRDVGRGRLEVPLCWWGWDCALGAAALPCWSLPVPLPRMVFAQSMAASRAVTLLPPSPFSHLFPQQILWELLFQPPYYPDILLHPPSSQLGLEVTIPAPPMVQGDPPSSSHG